MKWTWHIQIHSVIQPKGCRQELLSCSTDNFRRKEIALFYCDSEENKCDCTLWFSRYFLHFFSVLMFYYYYRAIIIRNGEVIPMSSEFTPETERQRLQYLVRDPRTKSAAAAASRHCLVTSKVQTHAIELLWLSEGPRVHWTAVTDHVCLLTISKHREKPGDANPSEKNLASLLWRPSISMTMLVYIVQLQTFGSSLVLDLESSNM